MDRQPLLAFGLALLIAVVAISAPVRAADKLLWPEQTVNDLRYGRVLYDYFQRDLFATLVQQQVAEARGGIHQQGHYPRLLQAVTLLEYGMSEQAEIQLQQLADSDVSPLLRDWSYYYLARLYYQTGNLEAARQSVQSVAAKGQKQIAGPLGLLTANIALRSGDLGEIESWLMPSAKLPWSLYIANNQAIAYRQVGYSKQAINKWSWLLRQPATSHEERLLKQRARLQLGFLQLENGQNPEAVKTFSAVEQQSYWSDRALLGFAQAHLNVGNFQQAATPLTQLVQRSSVSPEAHQSFLLLAQLYEQIGALPDAVSQYQQAMNFYSAELAQLDEAKQFVASEQLFSQKTQQQTLIINRFTPYLLELLVSDNFANGMGRLEELQFLQRNLLTQKQTAATLDSVLRQREQVLAMKSDYAREKISRVDPRLFHQRREVLSQRITDIETELDFAAVANEQQQRSWLRLKRLSANLQQLPEAERFNYQQRYDRLYGLLYWQLSESFAENLWQQKKQLASLNGELEQVSDQHQRLQLGFQQQPEKRAAAQQIINRSQPQIEQALMQAEQLVLRQKQQLVAQGLQLLERHQRQVLTDLTVAQTALAELYDSGVTSVKP